MALVTLFWGIWYAHFARIALPPDLPQQRSKPHGISNPSSRVGVSGETLGVTPVKPWGILKLCKRNPVQATV